MRYKLGVQYWGTKYSGFALCNGTSKPPYPTIMSTMEAALQAFCSDSASFSNFSSSSRTDAGVHALRNVCQVDIVRPCSTHSTPDAPAEAFIDPEMIRRGLNGHIRSGATGIYITDVSPVAPSFNARYEATARTYMYRILSSAKRRPNPLLPLSHANCGSAWAQFQADRAWVLEEQLDVTAMAAAARHLLGVQDFSTLRNAGCQAKSPIRNVTAVEVYANKQLIGDGLPVQVPAESAAGIAAGPRFLSLLEEDVVEICIVITANAFLQRMIRNAVGLLVKVGRGDLQVKDVRKMLDMRDRHPVGRSAPPQGLYLVDVHF